MRVLTKYLYHVLSLLISLVLTSCVSTGGRISTADDSGRGKVSEEKAAKKTRSVLGGGSSTIQGKPARVPTKYGVTTADSVSIRAGANENYEVLAKLSKGDKVAILRTAYGWHEVELPPGCVAWIHSDYVSTEGAPAPGKKVAGHVKGNSVRIRAVPGLISSVLAKANEGDKVTVVEVKDDWFGIEPTADCSGWVSSELVSILP